MTEEIPTPKFRQIACRKPLSVALALVAAIGIAAYSQVLTLPGPVESAKMKVEQK